MFEKKVALRVVGLYFLVTSIISIISTVYMDIIAKYLQANLNGVRALEWYIELFHYLTSSVVLLISIGFIFHSRKLNRSHIEENSKCNSYDKAENTYLKQQNMTLNKIMLLLLVVDSIYRLVNSASSQFYTYYTLKSSVGEALKYVSLYRISLKSFIYNIPVYLLYIFELIFSICFYIIQNKKLENITQYEKECITSETSFNSPERT